jgi:hypothetical protein
MLVDPLNNVQRMIGQADQKVGAACIPTRRRRAHRAKHGPL